MPFDCYVNPATVNDSMMLRPGLPGVDDIKRHLEKNHSPNWFFMFGDGSLMTTIWVYVKNAHEDPKPVWFMSGQKEPINDSFMAVMTTMGYTWPVDKFGNKILDKGW